MDTKFVVLSLLRQAEAVGASGEVTYAIRLDKTFDGRSGEGYILCFGDTVCLADRPLGQGTYRCQAAPLAEVRVKKLERGNSNSFADLDFAGSAVGCHWSWAENKDAERLLALFAGNAATAESPAQAPAAAPDRTAELFVAGLMYAAESSGQLSPEQEQLIRELAPGDMLTRGLDYYHGHDLITYVGAVRAAFNREQLLSLLANQLEVVMVDGDFRSAERRGMEELGRKLGFPAAEYEKILEVILCKNRSPLLFS